MNAQLNFNQMSSMSPMSSENSIKTQQIRQQNILNANSVILHNYFI